MTPLPFVPGIYEDPPRPEYKAKAQPPFKGVRTEVAEADAGAQQIVTIEVRGGKYANAGVYRLAFTGAKLQRYLARLKLKKAAAYSAVYDKTAPERGRLRLSYTPKVGSHIVISPPGVGRQSHLQRSAGDPRPKVGSPKEMEVPMTYQISKGDQE